AIEGLPMVWPDDLDPRYRSRPAKERLSAILQPPTFDVVAWDCDEFPCMAVVRSSSGDADEPFDLMQQGGLPAAFPIVGGYRRDGVVGKQWVGVLMNDVAYVTLNDAQHRRINFRARQLMATATSEDDE
ncbi:MAG: hypothetical protein ACI9MC_000829, partial [Kiritimatiellia bacterium]